ncbi:MAG: hypothetical protein IJP17_08035 [Clostridia bacterium]|nr:hypothetical protein [Clostridia bacterium]
MQNNNQQPIAPTCGQPVAPPAPPVNTAPTAPVVTPVVTPVVAPTYTAPSYQSADTAVPTTNEVAPPYVKTPPTLASVEAQKKANRKTTFIVSGIVAAAIAAIVLLVVISNAVCYKSGVENLNAGNYYDAIDDFIAAGSYKDAPLMLEDTYTALAEHYAKTGKAEKAYDLVTTMMDNDMYFAGVDACYSCAGILFDNEEYYDASMMYDAIPTHKDSRERSELAWYNWGVQLYREGEWETAYDEVFYNSDEDYEESALYFALCEMEYLKSLESGATDTSVFYEEYNELFNYLLPYADTNEDAMAALSSSPFFFSKFANAVWKDKDNKINLYLKNGENWMLIHNVEWDTPRGEAWYCYSTADGLKFYIDNAYWFTITGFSSATELRPEEVYITGNDGKNYTLELSKVHD